MDCNAVKFTIHHVLPHVGMHASSIHVPMYGRMLKLES